MSVFSAMARTKRKRVNRLYSFLLALTLTALGCGDLSADLLDKLKKQLGGDDQQEQTLDSDEVGSGLKEALRVGTETVVGRFPESTRLVGVAHDDSDINPVRHGLRALSQDLG